MRPDTQRPTADILAVEVVPRVLNHESDIPVPREIDGELDVPGRCGVDDVDGPAALGAGGVGEGGGWAGGGGGPLGVCGDGVVGAGRVVRTCSLGM